MSAPYDQLHEFIEDLGSHEAPWSERATAFVAMKKRAQVDPGSLETGISDRAYALMARSVAEKFALENAAMAYGLDKLAAQESVHADFFMKKLAARGDWEIPQIPEITKLSSMLERSAVVLHHLEQELGASGDPLQFMVQSFCAQDEGQISKVAALEAQPSAPSKKTKTAAAQAKLRSRVKKAMKKEAFMGVPPEEMHQHMVDGRKGLVSEYNRVKNKLEKNPSGLRAAFRKRTLRSLEKGISSFDDEIAKYKSQNKTSALKIASMIKKANEAGMTLEEYVAAEQQAQGQMEANELAHTRQVAEEAVQQNQQLAERAMTAEQQLMALQQQSAMAQQQAQMAMQAAADSEAQAAEQANAKLRMKMKIDQMRQTLADLATINPQMDEVGPEPGMPQPEAPAGPVQQQAAAQQAALVPPMDAESAKEQQEAAQAQQEAATQTQQAAAEKQEDVVKAQTMAAQVPMTAGTPGAPPVAPVM